MSDTSVAAPEPQDDSDELKACAWCAHTTEDVKDSWENLNGDTVFRGEPLCASCFWFAEREEEIDKVNEKYKKLTSESPRPSIF